MTQMILKPLNSVTLYKAMGETQALQKAASLVKKPSPRPSPDGNSTRKKRNRPDMATRLRCKMVAKRIEMLGPSAFTAIDGCDKRYLRCLLQDRVDLTNTVLDGE